MKDITLEELLEAGCHFGHQVNRKNPKASEFIYESRANVDIINLEDTQKGLVSAGAYLCDLAASGGSIILVGTKRQAQEIVRDTALKARKNGAQNLYFVSSRWIGGTLTNFSEVSKNFKRLDELTEIINKKDPQYTKRELGQFASERDKLIHFYEGIHTLTDMPSALVIVDIKHEETAVKEADTMGVEIVGVVDTNADPGSVTHAVPSNDDAVGAIRLLTTYLVDAWMEGEEKHKTQAAKEKADKETKEKNEKIAKAKEEEKTRKENVKQKKGK